MGDEDDFGFVADGGADDFGFVADEPESVAVPMGTRATGNRRIVLDETTIEGSPTGRGPRQTTVTPGTGYTEIEVEEKPRKLMPRRPRREPQPSLLDRLRERARHGAEAIEGVAGWAAPAVPGYAPLAISSDPAAAAWGAADATSLGFVDEQRGAADAAGSAIARRMGSTTDRAREGYAEARDRHRAAMRDAEERAPGAYGIGELAGSAPMALAPAGASTALGRIAVAGGQGFASGAIRGAGESIAEDTIAPFDQPSLARDALEQGALEGAMSAGGGVVGEAAVPVAQRVGQWARRQMSAAGDAAAQAAVQSRLEATGVWGGRAMRAADEMPGGQEALASDLRRLGIGGGLGQPGRTGPASRFPRPERALDDAAEAMDDAGQRMRSVLDRMDDAVSGAGGLREPGASGMVDLARVAEDMEGVAREYDRIPVGGPQVAAALRRQVVEPLSTRGAVPFSDAHRQRMHLDRMIRGWASDPNLSTVAGRLQTARRAISRAMDDAAGNLDPALRDTWRQANRDYSVGAFLGEHGRGAERLSVQGGMGGAFGAAIENAGGGAVAPIVGAPIQREAAQQVRMRWPGIRAVALETIAPRLRSLGARGQRWAQTLETAQRRGSTGLAAAHAILQRQDPAYRRAIEEMDEAAQSGEETSE